MNIRTLCLTLSVLGLATSSARAEMPPEEAMARYNTVQYLKWSQVCEETMNAPGMVEFAIEKSLAMLAAAGVGPDEAQTVINNVAAIGKDDDPDSLDDCEFFLPEDLKIYTNE